eukprot:jgi/Botrbrau1/20279/Bobra.31_1s0062.1
MPGPSVTDVLNAGGLDPAFRSNCTGYPYMYLDLTVPTNTSILVTMFFAEYPTYTAREMSVKIGGLQALQHYNIYKEAGYFNATQKTFRITTTSNVLRIFYQANKDSVIFNALSVLLDDNRPAINLVQQVRLPPVPFPPPAPPPPPPQLLIPSAELGTSTWKCSDASVAHWDDGAMTSGIYAIKMWMGNDPTANTSQQITCGIQVGYRSRSTMTSGEVHGNTMGSDPLSIDIADDETIIGIDLNFGRYFYGFSAIQTSKRRIDVKAMIYRADYSLAGDTITHSFVNVSSFFGTSSLNTFGCLCSLGVWAWGIASPSPAPQPPPPVPSPNPPARMPSSPSFPPEGPPPLYFSCPPPPPGPQAELRPPPPVPARPKPSPPSFAPQEPPHAPPTSAGPPPPPHPDSPSSREPPPAPSPPAGYPSPREPPRSPPAAPREPPPAPPADSPSPRQPPLPPPGVPHRPALPPPHPDSPSSREPPPATSPPAGYPSPHAPPVAPPASPREPPPSPPPESPSPRQPPLPPPEILHQRAPPPPHPDSPSSREPPPAPSPPAGYPSPRDPPRSPPAAPREPPPAPPADSPSPRQPPLPPPGVPHRPAPPPPHPDSPSSREPPPATSPRAGYPSPRSPPLAPPAAPRAREPPPSPPPESPSPRQPPLPPPEILHQRAPPPPPHPDSPSSREPPLAPSPPAGYAAPREPPPAPPADSPSPRQPPLPPPGVPHRPALPPPHPDSPSSREPPPASSPPAAYPSPRSPPLAPPAAPREPPPSPPPESPSPRQPPLPPPEILHQRAPPPPHPDSPSSREPPPKPSPPAGYPSPRQPPFASAPPASPRAPRGYPSPGQPPFAPPSGSPPPPQASPPLTGSTPPPSTGFPWRLSCARSGFFDFDKHYWEGSDTSRTFLTASSGNGVQSTRVDYATNNIINIPADLVPGLQGSCSGSPEMKLNLSIPSNVPSLVVTLYFSENRYFREGQRKMNISINGLEALSNFDIYATVLAQFTAVQYSFVINNFANSVSVDYKDLPPFGGAVFNAISVLPDDGSVSAPGLGRPPKFQPPPPSSPPPPACTSPGSSDSTVLLIEECWTKGQGCMDGSCNLGGQSASLGPVGGTGYIVTTITLSPPAIVYYLAFQIENQAAPPNFWEARITTQDGPAFIFIADTFVNSSAFSPVIKLIKVKVPSGSNSVDLKLTARQDDAYISVSDIQFYPASI